MRGPKAARAARQGAAAHPGLRSYGETAFCLCLSDRKSTRLNSSHRCITYAVFCLKKHPTIQSAHDLPNESIAIPQLYDSLTTNLKSPKACLTFFFFFMTGAPPKTPFFPKPALLQS